MVALHAPAVQSGSRAPTDYPGVIYLSIEQPHERTGGMASHDGDALALLGREFLQPPGSSVELR